MPLTALLEGEEMLAPLVPEGTWSQMKGRKPRPRLSCGAEAVAKTSKLGTQFFAHLVLPVGDEHKGESPEHLRVKSAIVVIAREHGWDARAEVAAPDRRWIADVLVEKNGRRIAFEVQLAGQTAKEYQRRQERYEQDGIECYWLVRRVDLSLHGSVPALQINFDESALTVSAWKSSRRWIGGDPVPLASFIGTVLEGDLRWRTRSGGDLHVAVSWVLHECYRCHELSVLHELDEEAGVRCDRCRTETSARPPAVKSTYPVRALGALGLRVQPAHKGWHLNYGSKGREFGWACWKCDSYFYRSHVEAALTWPAYVYTGAILGQGPLDSHWCSPGYAISSAAQVLSLLNGALKEPAESIDERSGVQLIEEARRRERFRHARQELAREARESLIRSMTTRDDLASELLPAPTDAGTDQRHWASPSELTDKAPPYSGPPVVNPHQRTTAIDSYTQEHLRHVDELVEIFPALDGECGCAICREIWLQFSKKHRKILWPGRSNSRIDWADQLAESEPPA